MSLNVSFMKCLFLDEKENLHFYLDNQSMTLLYAYNQYMYPGHETETINVFKYIFSAGPLNIKYSCSVCKMLHNSPRKVQTIPTACNL